MNNEIHKSVVCVIILVTIVSIMLESIKTVWIRYIRNASFHGLRYLAEPGLHWTER